MKHHVNSSDDHFNHLRSRLDRFDRERLHFNYDGQPASHWNDNSSGAVNLNSVTASEQSKNSDQFDLDNVLDSLNFQSDLQPRSSDNQEIVNDRLFHRYRGILRQYNHEYGVSSSVSHLANQHSHRRLTLNSNSMALSDRSCLVRSGQKIKDSLQSQEERSSARAFNYSVNREFENPVHRVGHRRYNSKYSYYRYSKWTKWVVTVTVIFVALLSGLSYQYFFDRASSHYRSSRSAKVHHLSRPSSVNSHGNLVSAGQNHQVTGLVDGLYGRINRLVNSSGQAHVAQLRFSSTPLSSFFVGGLGNQTCQDLDSRCTFLKVKNDKHSVKIKEIIPTIKSIRVKKNHIQVNLNSQIQFVVNHRKHRSFRVRNVKNRLALVEKNHKVRILNGDRNLSI